MSDTPDKRMTGEPIGDDVIMAYADGALAAGERQAVREALAQHPGMMETFEGFLFTRGPLARTFDAILAAPIPESLLRIVREDVPRTRRMPSLLGLMGLSGLAAVFRVPIFSPAVALPAVIVAVAGGWLAHSALRSYFVAQEDHGFVASASLQQALELTPRGSSAGVVEGVAFKPTFTFASVQQTWCRQYELSYGIALRSGGLACRGTDGAWRVIALTEPEPAMPATVPDRTVPAGKGDDILSETRAQIKSGDVLGRDAEARLIKERWPTKP